MIFNYLIAEPNISAAQAEVLKRWITDGSFEQCESSEYLVSSSRKRPHNHLYRFMLAGIDCQVVMKVSHIYKGYNRLRRLRALLKYYFQRDANHKAFQCCLHACRNNLGCPVPLAYWQKRDGTMQIKSYFLYQYKDGMPWSEVSDKLEKIGDGESQQHRDILKRKIIYAVSDLHRAGIRHGDMVAHNILICIKDTDWARASICFVDYDRATLVGFTKPVFLKRFFDLRDLRKLYLDDASPYDLLDIYLEDRYHPLWRAVLALWRLAKH